MTMPSDESPSTDLVVRETSELVATRKAEREEKKKRRMLGWLIGGGAAVVIAALVVSSITLGWFAPATTSDAGGPIAPPNSSPSATPGATDAAAGGSTDAGAGAGETTETEPVGPPAPVVETFTLTPEVAECEDDRNATVPLSFSWTTTGADRGWFGEAVSDASLEPTAEIPTSAEGWSDVSFQCRYTERDFTITFEGPGGKTSYSVTVQRVLL